MGLLRNRVRTLAAGGVVVVVAVVLLLALSGRSPYRVRALFSDASGLVTGDQVMIGPSVVGSVGSIRLSSRGQAAITLSLYAGITPLHAGTVARIEENGLAGIASHYVTLQPGANSGSKIPSGGTIPERDTHAEVSLDQLFDTLNPLTRAGLANVIKGEATSTKGKAEQANRALEYLAPALGSTSQVTAQLDRYEPAFDSLLVEGAKTMEALASRSEQLTDLVDKTATATGAIAGRSSALAQTLALLPKTLTRSTGTLAGLRGTLTALDPVVAEAKPATRQLGTLATALNKLAKTALPTVTALEKLIASPTGGNLTKLLNEAPALERVAKSAFPALIAAVNGSQAQTEYLREYAPDIVAALADLGQASSNYDANGHYVRAQPFFGAFGIDAENQLQTQPPANRYDGLETVSGRCPGAAVQTTPDRSAPRQVTACNRSSTPPGP